MSEHPCKVLVLEENPVERDLLVMALRRAGFEAQPAASVFQTIKTFQRTPPDVLILNIHMKQGSGIELLQYLSTEGFLRACIALVVTELAFPAYIQQAKQAGARDFLVKPVNMDFLVTRINRLLSSVKPGASSPLTPAA